MGIFRSITGRKKERVYDIWIEGYSASGDQSSAQYAGTASAPSFKEACVKMMKMQGWRMTEHYDEVNNSYWGCRFFDNEADARKSFG